MEMYYTKCIQIQTLKYTSHYLEGLNGVGAFTVNG